MPVVAVAAAVAFSAVGAAAAVGTAIGVVAFAGVSLATISAVASVGAAVAGMLAQTMKPKVEGSGPSPIEFKADPNAHMPFALGRVGVGGNIVFAQTAGSKNKWLHYVTVLSAFGPIQGIESFSGNDTPIVFGAGGVATDARYGGKKAVMWQRQALGDEDQAALTPARELPEWTANHRLRGKAHTLWTLEANSEKYPNGTPKPLWVLLGIKVTDPRTGQRAYSTNPYCHAYQYALGYFENGKRVGGMGVPPAGVDRQAFIDGANIADANNWRISGNITSGMNKWATLTAILGAGGGKPLHRGHLISCIVNTPRVSIATIEEGDLLESASVDAGQLKRQRFNRAIPRFRSERHRWTVVPGRPLSNPNYIADDGGIEKSREVTLDLVSDHDGGVQAGQLAAYALADGREHVSARVTVGPKFMHVRAGAAVTINIPKLGLVNQKCLVVNRRFDPKSFLLSFTVQTETDSKHPWALGQSTQPPKTPALVGIDDTLVPPPTDGTWVVSAPQVQQPAGGMLPMLRVTRSANEVDDPNAIGIIVDYRPVDANGNPLADWRSAEFPPSSTVMEIPVEGNVRYETAVRYKYRNGQENPEVATQPVIVTTAPIVAQNSSRLGDVPAGEILTDISDLYTVFGSTESAAASASSAAASASSAATARQAAEAASGAATAARQAAETAQSQAEAARTSAQGAEANAVQQALNASNSASAASGYASQASGSATAAQTSAGQASTSAGQASTSATGASGSASSAATSATTAASLRDNTVHVSSQRQPSRAATIENFYAFNGPNGSASHGLPPEQLAITTGGTVVNTPRGAARQFTGFWNIWSRQWLRVESGRTYRLAFESRVVTNGHEPDARYLVVSLYRSDGSITAVTYQKTGEPNAFYNTNSTAELGWTRETYTLTGSDMLGFRADAYWARVRVQHGRKVTGDVQLVAGTGSTWQVTEILFEDISAETNAANSASAAASSASSAATSATTAGQHASSAQTSATNASTSASNAATSASQASTSASNASGSASSASTSASNAANSATAAGNSATAAGNSASAASTSATNAGNSASSAQTSATSASTSAGNAGTSATNAANSASAAQTSAGSASTSASQASTSASNAAGSASAAQTSATNAANSATTAGNSATAASTSASNAATSATNAGNSATSASNSATSASTSAGNASTSAGNAATSASDASTSASQASTSASNASSSASNASTSATNAANSATSAGNSATAASTSASNAATSATNAGNSASSASTSATNAANSAGSAGNSATAASTSASNAATSATNAGSSASSASTSATNAANSSSSAGNSASAASTSASSASSSATNAAGSASSASSSANTASTSAGNASNSASSASSSAATASSQASAAQQSATLSASIVGRTVPGDFKDRGRFWSTQQLPINHPPIGTNDIADGFFVDYASEGRALNIGSGWHTGGIYGRAGLPLIRGRTYRLTVRSYSTSGEVRPYFAFHNAAGDAGGYAYTQWTAKTQTANQWQTLTLTYRHGTDAIQSPGNGSSTLIYPAMDVYSGVTSVVLLRLEDITDIAALESAQSSLSASVSTHAGVLTTLQGRALAFWQQTTNAGAAGTFIEARSEASWGAGASSTVSVGAREVHIYNQIAGLWRRTLSLSGGDAVFTGNISSETGFFLGSGVRWRVAYAPKDFVVTDGQVISFGANLGNIPIFEFRTAGLAPLNTGETYRLFADNASATGFTARLRIITPGGTASYNLTVDTAPGTGPTRQIDKAGNPDASNHTYNLRFQGSFTTDSYYIDDGDGRFVVDYR